MARRKAPAYTNTRIKRLPVSRIVSDHWAGIEHDARGMCCGDEARQHMVTVKANGSVTIKCTVEHCPCKTWLDGWVEQASAPVGESPLKLIQWEG